MHYTKWTGSFRIKVARECCLEGTLQAGDSSYRNHCGGDWLGDSMARTHVTAGLDDDAIIAFLMFCLEIYKAELHRKKKLH